MTSLPFTDKPVWYLTIIGAIRSEQFECYSVTDSNIYKANMFGLLL